MVWADDAEEGEGQGEPEFCGICGTQTMYTVTWEGLDDKLGKASPAPRTERRAGDCALTATKSSLLGSTTISYLDVPLLHAYSGFGPAFRGASW